MFDVGFSELLLTALVALVVFGPERLPQAARTAGLWIGRFKRVLSDTRREVERELGADDIRRQLHNEAIMKSLHEPQQAIERVLKDEVMVEPEKNSTADENGKSAP
ncbi:MAG: twin-arginine translocase subunit TatB [Cellvibrionales bacterium]|jgi:sec-independent protein translocase protein TatB|nr:twin-arginine translocase subunit TatB [Cellvibrionales bacterium]MBK8676371.1 twin-arginine translocase subunit TatB [Cellvibrionales bacterium]HRF88838.1 Sec-independent protein translocase protein TatB [Pseudomonadales bacterium]